MRYSCLAYLHSFIFIFLITEGFGQQIEVNQNFATLQLDRHVEIFEDATKSLQIRDIFNQNPDFKKAQGSTLNFGYQNSYFWIHFNIRNADTIPADLILEIENPHINKVQLFTIHNQNLVESPLTGDNLPFATRILNHPHFLFPISIGSKDSKSFYLWIDKHGEQVQCPIRLSNSTAFSEHNSRLMVFWGFLIGIVVLFAFLSAMIFILYNQSISFYYMGYAMSSCIFLIAHTGIGFQYLWSNQTWWQSAARPTTALLIYSFYVLFAQSFFRIKERSRLLFGYTTLLIIALYFFILILWVQHPVIGIVENYWYHPTFYSGVNLLTYMKTVSLTASLVLISVLLIGIYYFIRERKLENLWFMLSAAMLFMGAISTLLVFSGALPGNLITKNLPLLTTSAETLILALLLANRWSAVRRKNVQITSELIEQRQQSAMNLIEGQMIERKRLSQQLHDSISATLANMRMRLSMYLDASHNNDEDLRVIENDLKRTGEDVRQISHDLSPVLLERYGLGPALDELVEMTRTAHPKKEIKYISDSEELSNIPDVIQKTVFYTMQEILNNITKHGQASSIAIILSKKQDQLILEFKDDGINYDPSVDSNGIGLSNLISRIDLLNGISEIRKNEQGMIHKFEIPIHSAQSPL